MLVLVPLLLQILMLVLILALLQVLMLVATIGPQDPLSFGKFSMFDNTMQNPLTHQFQSCSSPNSFSGIPHHASSSSNSHLEFQRYPPYQMFGSMHKVYVQLCLNITVAAIIIRDFFGFAHHFSRIFHTSHLHGR